MAAKSKMAAENFGFYRPKFLFRLIPTLIQNFTLGASGVTDRHIWTRYSLQYILPRKIQLFNIQLDYTMKGNCEIWGTATAFIVSITNAFVFFIQRCMIFNFPSCVSRPIKIHIKM